METYWVEAPGTDPHHDARPCSEYTHQPPSPPPPAPASRQPRSPRLLPPRPFRCTGDTDDAAAAAAAAPAASTEGLLAAPAATFAPSSGAAAPGMEAELVDGEDVWDELFVDG